MGHAVITVDLIRLFKHVSRHRRRQLAALLVLMLLGAVAEMATLGAVVPFLALLADPGMAGRYPILKKILFWVGGSVDNMLLSVAIFFGVIAVGAGLVRMLLTWVSLRISFGLGADIGGEVYRRTLYQPYSWHVSKNSSEILSGIDKVNAVVGNIISPLTQGAIAFVLSLGILAMLLAIDPLTALISGAGFSLLYGVTTLTLRPMLARNSKIVSDNLTHRVQAVQEGLGGIRDVLLDGTQPIYQRRFAVFDYGMRRAQAANNFIGAAPRYIIEASGMALIVALAYWLGGRQGGLTGAIPILGALAIGAQKLLPQMQLVYYSWSSISGNRDQLKDVLDLLDCPIPPEYAQPSTPSTFPPVSVEGAFSKGGSISAPRTGLGSQPALNTYRPELVEGQLSKGIFPLIALRNISFRYKPELPYVLQNTNLEIPQGARIGIIGKTGSGKSTLIDLMMGLLDPSTGHIEINGQPLTAHNRRSWQKRIAHVPQAIYLSDTSIAENIAFGTPIGQIDLDRVRTAARKAELVELIEALPQNYQTSVGERGVRLSGGQRQRIGLARALYKEADVLVLDEATSALDDATEKSIMQAIQALGKEITVLIIAHRVTTLSDCDQIIELGDAKILRMGNYLSLIGASLDTSLSDRVSGIHTHA